MSVGMKITCCADNMSDKNPTIVTRKDNRGWLDRILATGSGVMCGGLREGGKACAQKDGDVRGSDQPKAAHEAISSTSRTTTEVIVNVTGEPKSSVITRPVSQDHNRTAPGDVRVRSASRRIC